MAESEKEGKGISWLVELAIKKKGIAVMEWRRKREVTGRQGQVIPALCIFSLSLSSVLLLFHCGGERIVKARVK